MLNDDLEIGMALEEHWLQGRIETGGLRLQEILNSQTTDYLRLHDIRLRGIDGEACPISDCIVRKAQLALVMPLGDKHEAPEKRVYSFVNKQEQPTLILAHSYEVRGRLHIKSTTDPVSLLTSQIGAFLPVTQATISKAGSNQEPLQVPLVLVNRERISFLHLD
jgi:hypothetical protein